MPNRFTRTEEGFDRLAHRLLANAPTSGPLSWLVEFAVFVVKQAWACVFGGAMLAVIFATSLWYPATASSNGATLAKNDFLTIAAVLIQLVMVVARLETLRELRVIVLFHIVGTGMELFKTAAGSWEYESGGVLHIGAVPLFSGFMYAAVGSYMVRVFRLFDLRFDRYPPRWITAIIAVLIYVNFFTHHWIWDFRYVLLAAVIVVYARTWMHFRIFRVRLRMPVLLSFLLVAIFIWFAENIGTLSQAWTYPNQHAGWQLVSVGKLGSWFLLMIISVVLVTWVYRPRPPDRDGEVLQTRYP